MAKETYYKVLHLRKTKLGLEWRELRTYTDKKSALNCAKNETGKNLVQVVKSETMYDNGKKVW